MMKKGTTWLFVAMVTLLPVTVFAVVRWLESSYKTLPVYGPENHRVAAYLLTDQTGTEVGNAAKKIAVTNFFFTRCPVVCPKMTRQLKTVQQAFIADSNVVIRSITVDPVRDAAAQLEVYAKRFGIADNWQLLTGDKKEIYRLARKSFLVDASDGDGGPDDFLHSDKLVLTDSNGRIRGYYMGTEETEIRQLIKDIGKLRKDQ